MESSEECAGRAPGSGSAGQEPPRRSGLIPGAPAGTGSCSASGEARPEGWREADLGLLWPEPRSRLGSGAGGRGRAGLCCPDLLWAYLGTNFGAVIPSLLCAAVHAGGGLDRSVLLS